MEIPAPHSIGYQFEAMRRSSRIQFKQESTSTEPKSESQLCKKSPQLSPVKTHKQIKSIGPISASSSAEARVQRKRDLKRRRKNREQAKSKRPELKKRSKDFEPETTKQNDSFTGDLCKVEPSISKIESNNDNEPSVSVLPILNQDESSDSIYSDVANSIKIDRTIKNLSPKKFFINKDGKTTRSGRSFSPYDFATYSLLFGSKCLGGAGPSELCDSKSAKNPPARAPTKKKPSQTRKRAHDQQKRLRKQIGKNHQNRKPYKRRNKREFVAPTTETTCVDNSFVSEPAVMITSQKNAEVNSDLYSEEVPAAFLIDFPPTQVSQLEGHSLPPDFFSTSFDTFVSPSGYSPTHATNWPHPEMDPVDMDALSQVSLGDTDKYEFKSLFKDIRAQIAHFENYCGLEVPGGDGHKYDLTESEAAEGRRFYRKRITDSRLIAWHKYNLMSSTRYAEETDPPPARPIIKIRTNLCQRADIVWRLNQTLPPPTIEDVLNLPQDPSDKR